MLDSTTQKAAQDTECLASGAAGSVGQAALPRIFLDGPVAGNVVISDGDGQLFCVNANNGTIRRLRWD